MVGSMWYRAAMSYRASPVILSLGLLLGILPGTAAAQPVGAPLEVSVDRMELGLQDSLQLTIRSVTQGFGRGNLESPLLSDWQIVGQMERTGFDGAAGVQQRVIVLTLKPLKAGELTIGSFTLKGPDGEVKSQPITIRIGNGAANGNPNGNPNGSAPTEPTPEAPDALAFMRWELDRTELWLGEPTEVELVLYYNRQVRVTDATAPEINLEGFWTQELQGRGERRLVQFGNEVFVREPLAHRLLVPIKSGALSLAGVGMRLTLAQVQGNRRGSQAVERLAPEIPLNIKALPEAGRPAGFKGPAVGRLVLEAGADRTQVKAADGLQLTVTTQIEGMLQNVPVIELPDLPGFRVFPPSDAEQSAVQNGKLRGVRRQTWLLRPEKNGDLVIPSLTLPYFDPTTGQYAVARTRPINVQATGAVEGGGDGPIIEAGPVEGTPAALPLRDVRKQAEATVTSMPIYTGLFLGAVVVPPALFLLLLLRDRMRHSRSQSAGSRAARQAAGAARKALDRLARAGGDEAYGAIARTLLTYLEARFGRAFRGLTHPDIRRVLAQAKVDEATIGQLIAELEHCDFARFAPVAGSGGVAESVTRSRQIIDRIEGAVR
jgi:hypothetical protein